MEVRSKSGWAWGLFTAIAVAVALALLPAPAQAQSFAFGAYSPGINNDPAKLDAFTAAIGQPPAIVSWYREWNDRLIYPSELENVSRIGAVPMIGWEPHDESLKRIGHGRYDRFLHRSAAAAAAWGGPILLRFAHEMNGDWYPWGTKRNTAHQYRHAWKRIVRVFRSERARNVRFVWSPNVDDDGEFPFRRFYPGGRWVDWVALDGYNFGARFRNWQSVRQLFGSSYRRLTRMTNKPMFVAETASVEAGGDKARWIERGLRCQLPRMFPEVRAIVWFDRSGPSKWGIHSSAAALAALRGALASPNFGLSAADLLALRRAPPRPDC